jgi:hypothetical protein
MAIIVATALMIASFATVALAATGNVTLSGVLAPVNGVWLDSGDGGHFWDVDGNGICRVDTPASGPVERTATCDKQSKKPTQVVAGPQNADGTYFLYVSDMSSKSLGPLRLVFDPTGDSGKGTIVPNSASILGGVDTIGFYTNPNKAAPPGTDPPGGDLPTGSYRNSSVALGPCSATITTPCTALYVAFLRTKRIERINFVDQILAQQSIETISMTNAPRKGVRYGIATFHNPDGTDDLYIDELAGEGVSVMKNIARCTPTEGSPVPGTIDAPTHPTAGCPSPLVSGITTTFAQGIAVQENTDGTGRYVYVGDSPVTMSGSVLRYQPATGFQDVVSTSVTPYDSLLNPGQTVSTYTTVTGLAVNPHDGDVYVADDPSLQQVDQAVAHVFTLAGDSTQTVPADCTGSAATKCGPPVPPDAVTASLYAYGVTNPAGGPTFIPSDDGGHLWLADSAAGLCRFDIVPQAPELRAINPPACDDASVLGAGGQAVYDDTVVAGTTNDHYIFVAQTTHLQPGVIRFTFDPSANSGVGGLVPDSTTVMVPNSGLDGSMAVALALGPCRAGSPTPCQYGLYVAGLDDGYIRRINNPESAPDDQTVDVVAVTATNATGNPGPGVNGSMGMLGDSLYVPEDSGFFVLRNASTCGVNAVVCATVPLNLGTFEAVTGTAIAVDPNPLHSAAGLVYASQSPINAPATIYQYDVATGRTRIYTTEGQMPAAGTAAATVYCSLTCTLPVDPEYPPGELTPFRHAQGLYVNPLSDDGILYITEDATGGSRAQRGHIWVAPFTPFPSS